MNSIYVYVLSRNSALMYLVVMCIFVICKYLSWDSNQQQDVGKPSQNIDWKLLSKDGLIRCSAANALATQVCIKQSVI